MPKLRQCMRQKLVSHMRELKRFWIRESPTWNFYWSYHVQLGFAIINLSWAIQKLSKVFGGPWVRSGMCVLAYTCFFVILYICIDASGALHNAIVSVHCSLPPAVMSVIFAKGFLTIYIDIFSWIFNYIVCLIVEFSLFITWFTCIAWVVIWSGHCLGAGAEWKSQNVHHLNI